MGDVPDVLPRDAADAFLWNASAVERAGVAEHLWTGDDPWIKEARELADKEHRRLVVWPVNWSVDDTGIKVFSPVGGKELRLGYHWTDAVRVRRPRPPLTSADHRR